MDTVNDLRIQWVEKLFEKIKGFCRGGAIKDKNKICDRIEGKIKGLKFSYAEEDVVLEYIDAVKEMLKELQGAVGSEEAGRWLDYVISELEDMPRKMRLEVSEPHQLFRYKFVEVVSVSKHPSLKKLRITKVRDEDGAEYSVTTNLEDVKQGMQAVVVFLPPKAFGGIWSEAMFVAVGVNKVEGDLKELNQYFFST